MRNKRGITLIALIITIIVMLILVAVVINVAYQERLFEKARVAAYNTQREAYKEELLSAVASTYDEITAENVKKGLSKKWQVRDNEDETLLICSVDEYVFIVNKNKKTIQEGENSLVFNSFNTKISERGDIIISNLGISSNSDLYTKIGNIDLSISNNDNCKVIGKSDSGDVNVDPKYNNGNVEVNVETSRGNIKVS